MSFDTTFLIDLQMEKLARKPGPAHQFLRQSAGVQMALSSVVLGEFAEGFQDPDDPVLLVMAAAVQILEVDAETAMLYGSNARRLKRAGKLIGANDLWIGCYAVRYNLLLVSRNKGDFERIRNLKVLGYGCDSDGERIRAHARREPSPFSARAGKFSPLLLRPGPVPSLQIPGLKQPQTRESGNWNPDCLPYTQKHRLGSTRVKIVSGSERRRLNAPNPS